VPKTGKNVKSLLTKLILILAIAYGLIYLATLLNQSNYVDCERYTNELNGGTHAFKKGKYTVKLCGADKILGRNTKIRLQVFDEKGTLQALRYFVIRFSDAAPTRLEYGDENIFYYDYSLGEPLSSISIPPSTADRMKAIFFIG